MRNLRLRVLLQTDSCQSSGRSHSRSCNHHIDEETIAAMHKALTPVIRVIVLGLAPARRGVMCISITRLSRASAPQAFLPLPPTVVHHFCGPSDAPRGSPAHFIPYLEGKGLTCLCTGQAMCLARHCQGSLVYPTTRRK